MSSENKYDDWLNDGGPAALVLREPLEPIEGSDGIFFPATFAAAEDKSKFAGGYNIDDLRDGTGANVCLVDSVGSQANRIEPIFARSKYADLVPQVLIKAGDTTVNLLDAGHRAGDAIARCSELREELQAAFKEVLVGNVEPLAKIAPTSLVFGVWDSRDTQAKLPRLVSSTIRAFNVRELRRSAQFVPATNYVANGLLDAPTDTKTADDYAKRGFVHVPASGSHGGVQLTKDGVIRRDAILSLSALRRLSTRDEKTTIAVRRYILGLSLVALTAPQDSYLRQGCNLVPVNEGNSRDFQLVHSDGRREKCNLTHDDALEFAKSARQSYQIVKERKVSFSKKLAEKEFKDKKK
jgi:CRISPR-associated protein Csb1